MLTVLAFDRGVRLGILTSDLRLFSYDTSEAEVLISMWCNHGEAHVMGVKGR